MQIAPHTIDETVLRFCETISPNEKPRYVPVHVSATARPLMCFVDVEATVSRKGGEAVFGWEITLVPKMFLEAEAHAIWKRPDGSLVSISPQPFGQSRILFLADPYLKRSEELIPNRRFSLGAKEKVDQYLFLVDACKDAPEHIARSYIYKAEQIRIEIQGG